MDSTFEANNVFTWQDVDWLVCFGVEQDMSNINPLKLTVKKNVVQIEK